MLDATGDEQRDQRNRDIQSNGCERRGRHVIHAQQIKPCDQTARHGTNEVPAVEEPQPRDAVRRCLNAARNDGQRPAHQQRRRQQADAGDQCSKNQAGHPGPRPGGVDAAKDRHAIEDQDSECADAELQVRIHAERMLDGRHIARQQQAAEAHATHINPEQHAERYGRRADRQLQQLEPDDLVYQRSAAGSDEQQQ
jgi:hypothetical protein